MVRERYLCVKSKRCQTPSIDDEANCKSSVRPRTEVPFHTVISKEQEGQNFQKVDSKHASVHAATISLSVANAC